MEEQSKEEELLQLRLEYLKLRRKLSLLEGNTLHEDPSGVKTSTATTSPPFSGNITSQANESDISKLASVIIAATKNTMCNHSLDLPKYNGSHSEWLAFQAAYMQTARHMTDVENMARLRRCLVGKAKEAVKNLLIYQSDPLKIMKSLESRFGRPDAIAITELETLKKLPKPGIAPRDLCIFTTTFCNIVCSLEALGKIYYLYNPEITRSTVEKLSPTLQHRFFAYAAQQPKQEADLLKLKRFLCIEAENCAPFARPESNFVSEKPQIKFQRAYETEMKEKPQAKLQQGYVTKDLKVCDKCVICDENHNTVNNEKAQDLLEQQTHQEVDGIFETTMKNHSPPETYNIAHKSKQAVGIQLDRISELETRYEQEIKINTDTNKNLVEDVAISNVNNIAIVEQATPLKVRTGHADTSTTYKSVSINDDQVKRPNLQLKPIVKSPIRRQLNSMVIKRHTQESIGKIIIRTKGINVFGQRAKGKNRVYMIVKRKRLKLLKCLSSKHRSNWKREEMVRKWKAYSSKERIQQNSRVQVQYRREPHDTGKVKIGFVDFTSDNCLPYKKWTYDIVADTILSQEGDIKVADPITESIPERPARKPIILPTNGAILHHGDDASSVKDNRATHGGRMFRTARVRFKA
ncbi:unnamed protein product [Leptosia nina]|uniref:Uncharacterized protein n=1 Tax=Leptosia nina TaxID=320188 RepID=A0AAV1JMU6_9NEOP